MQADSSGPSHRTQGGPSEENSSSLLLPLGLSSKDLQCPICVETIHEAFVTSCGHSFCHACLSMHLQHRPSCPSCGAFLTMELCYPNFLLNKVRWRPHEHCAAQHISPSPSYCAPDSQPSGRRRRRQRPDVLETACAVADGGGDSPSGAQCGALKGAAMSSGTGVVTSRSRWGRPRGHGWDRPPSLFIPGSEMTRLTSLSLQVRVNDLEAAITLLQDRHRDVCSQQRTSRLLLLQAFLRHARWVWGREGGEL